VFVHESPDLVALLMQVNLDRQIPAQLYVAVAEVMAWLARMETGATADAVSRIGGIFKPVNQGTGKSQ